MRVGISNIAEQAGAADNSDRPDSTTAFRFRESGQAAGGAMSGWGIWGSIGYSDFEGSPVFGTAITNFDGKLWNGLFGADVRLGERVILGAALGYEDQDTDTAYNGGNIEADGFTIAPYALVMLTDNISIDATIGYSNLENEQIRIDPADSAAGALVFLRGSFDSDRWFFGTNLNASFSQGPWVITGQIGYLKTQEEQDGYTETGGTSFRTVADREIDLSQGHVSGEVAYAGMSGWEPYARVGYYNDFSRDDGQGGGGLPGSNVRTDFDDDEFRVAAGVRFYGASFSGGLEFETETGRDDFETWGLLFSIRTDF
jgi:outer membrane autotransporter protein